MTRRATTRSVDRPHAATSTVRARLGLLGLVVAAVALAVGRPGVRTGWPPLLRPASMRVWWTSHDPLDAAAGLATTLCAVVLVYLGVVGALRVWSLRSGRTRISQATARLLPRAAVVMTATLLTTTTVAHAATTSPGGAGPDGGSIDRPGPRMEVLGSSTPPPASTTRSTTSTTIGTVAAPPDPPPPAVYLAPTSTAPAASIVAPSTAVRASLMPSTAVPTSVDTIDPATAAVGSPGVEVRTSLPWASADASPSGTEVPDTAPAGLPVPSPGQGPTLDTYVVQAGDHLWSIAERVVGQRLGAPPDEGQVTDYWSALIDENRDRLVDADNPDLILTGQVFLLPAA